MYAKEKLAILCTAFTNIAVDNLVEGLMEVGVKVIRLGRPEKVLFGYARLIVFIARLETYYSVPRWIIRCRNILDGRIWKH